MQTDQAANLRQLISGRSDGLVSAPSQRYRLTILSGSKGGVGVSTLGLNLSVALRKQVDRVLLVDCHPQRGDLASIYRLRGQHDLDDVIRGRCSVQEAITTGPYGIQIAPTYGMRDTSSAASCWQVLRSLDEITSRFDHVVVDAGSCLAQAEVFFPVADHCLIVTTVDQVAVTDSYAFIKTLVRRGVRSKIAIVCNRYQNNDRAIDAEQRIASSCQQFLGLEIKHTCRVPFDPHWERAVAEGRSVLCINANSAAAMSLHALATRLTSTETATIGLNSIGLA